MTDKKEVVAHATIYEALAFAQGEFPEIQKTKDFGKPGDKMHFKYASLDDVLNAVRPVTSKHGLCFSWEDSEDKLYMRCVLRHTSTTVEYKKVSTRRTFADTSEESDDFRKIEQGVLYSPYVKVNRAGEMKSVGSDSTYARRYTLCEVLGVASEEDKDIGRQDTLEKNVVTKFKMGIQGASTVADVEKAVAPIKNDYDKYTSQGKKSNLGFTKETELELIEMAQSRIIELGGKKVAGENSDLGGEATINDKQ
jgi:hypothetical protein